MTVLANALTYDRLVPYAVATLALLWLVSSMRRQRQRSAARNAAPTPPGPPPGATAGVRRDLDFLLVELQELSRRISAQIDTRFAKLEAAMRDADRRIAALNRLSRETPTQPVSEPRTTIAQPTQVPSATTVTDPRHSVIYELADAGFSPVDIARDLGRTPGEVELILNLRRHSRN
jgi:hypothetical protein